MCMHNETDGGQKQAETNVIWWVNCIGTPRLLQSGGGPVAAQGDQKAENLRKQHEILKEMLEQLEQVYALQGREAALLTMQLAEQAIAVMDDTGEGERPYFWEFLMAGKKTVKGKPNSCV